MEKPSEKQPVVAYFSMEVGINPALPTYAGGLGILAGDSLRSAADLGIPMVGITLLYRKGYFRQHFDAVGNQTESPVEWKPEESLEPLGERAAVTVDGRQVWLKTWRYILRSPNGNEVPVFFLDTALPENDAWDQTLTDYLYGGDNYYRLCQEVVLGLGGVAILRALGYSQVITYHMNEGHSSLLVLSLLKENSERSGLTITDKKVVEQVRQQCVFTTHTPVPAGMDKFPLAMARQVLGSKWLEVLEALECLYFDTLNMTELALFFSRYINGVSMRHEEISHHMFPSFPINSVTNGVHGVTWTSEPFRRLYDRYVPEWRDDNLYLRYIVRTPLDDIRRTHLEAKQELFAEVAKRTGVQLNPTVMTIGFARRMTPYKRADLLFTDLERLKKIVRDVGPLQIIYGGKAHPSDNTGKEIIRKVFAAGAALAGIIPVVFIENYDMEVARLICAGVDLWLNTPKSPEEASGTSGMKAALNGVPSLSTLDGWWIEGHIEGVTGWSIGDSWKENVSASEAASLYDKLEFSIVPKYYREPAAFDSIRRTVIAVNASYYNTQRMMFQYLNHAYMPF